jgi:catechol 2,3-dioxygenase-like lactoylglutathione lyase family enzyme
VERLGRRGDFLWEAVEKEFAMRPRFGMLTLGVDDLERALKFYRDGLGFESEGIVGEEYEHGAAAFFKLEGGMQLIVAETRGGRPPWSEPLVHPRCLVRSRRPHVGCTDAYIGLRR